MRYGSQRLCYTVRIPTVKTSRLPKSFLRQSRPTKRKAIDLDYRFTHRHIASPKRTQIPVAIACCTRRGADSGGYFATAIHTMNIVKAERWCPKNQTCHGSINPSWTGTDGNI